MIILVGRAETDGFSEGCEVGLTDALDKSEGVLVVQPVTEGLIEDCDDGFVEPPSSATGSLGLDVRIACIVDESP